MHLFSMLMPSCQYFKCRITRHIDRYMACMHIRMSVQPPPRKKKNIMNNLLPDKTNMTASCNLQLVRQKSTHRCVPLDDAVMLIHVVLKTSMYCVLYFPEEATLRVSREPGPRSEKSPSTSEEEEMAGWPTSTLNCRICTIVMSSAKHYLGTESVPHL